uniref:Uncharacterized protein n=1 Tax=Physcomitrium patens TaxID=3218 RepID=A0A2K1J6R3_PHYPA|nr:hypothetical protein PHYPA_020332 [Physcomitrium patens]
MSSACPAVTEAPPFAVPSLSCFCFSINIISIDGARFLVCEVVVVVPVMRGACYTRPCGLPSMHARHRSVFSALYCQQFRP